MGLLNVASSGSVWRGYECYKANKILEETKVSDTEFAGKVAGSSNNSYDVFIDVEHVRKSHCNCPHANGKRIVCKHQIALFFSAFPEEAEKYYKNVVAYEEEEERRQIELEDKVSKYIDSLSEDELRQMVYSLLYDSPDWVFERFVRDYIEDYDE